MRSGLTKGQYPHKRDCAFKFGGNGFFVPELWWFRAQAGAPSLGDSPIANDGSGGDPSNSGSGPPSNEGSLPGDGSHSGTPPNPGSTPISSGGGSNSEMIPAPLLTLVQAPSDVLMVLWAFRAMIFTKLKIFA